MRRRTRRALVYALASLAALLLLAAAPEAPPGEAVYTITLDDIIHPISARFLKEAIDKANDARAALLIIDLDTPGGLSTSMEEMIHSITSSHVPVVVFVNGSKAASAGFFLTISADVAVMAPGTRMGAAHPVAVMGEIPKDSPMMAKIENDAAAYARTLATNRGRNARAAEDAVRKSSSFTEQEALKLGLIDFIAHDETEILKLLDGRTIRRFDGRHETLHLARVRLVSLDMTGRERFLSMLANPTLAAFLLFIGIIGLYVEFTHPGLIAPGLVGGVCILLFALSTQMLPVNWVGVSFVILGIVMFLLELKVPSYGTLTIGGILCLVVGSLMLFKTPQAVGDLGVARGAILGIGGSAAVIMGILTTLVVRAWRRRPTTGTVGLLSEVGTAMTDLDPEGKIFVHGEYWNARAASPITKGSQVRVVRVRDMMLDVEAVH
ncbi:MAG TPA: nodulation protein NfeD [Candidatus Polarisedimenticolia bacterium]|nr:nodulation protein NfeD [Candidatus Polarisedimenticolia bacterium]